jgi:hypothetical protein
MLKSILEENSSPGLGWGEARIDEPWLTIFKEAHVYHFHSLEPFSSQLGTVREGLRLLVGTGQWADVLGWLEFVMKHRVCPSGFAKQVDGIMQRCRLGYRVIDKMVICPVGSEAERKTIERAFADLRTGQFHGAQSHLSNAAKELTGGNFAGSIRESIQAVESVVRVLEPKGDFAKAFAKLDAKRRFTVL